MRRRPHAVLGRHADTRMRRHRDDAGEDDGHASRRGRARRRASSRPARPAVPVGDTGMPVAVPSSWARTIAASGTTSARPPERPHDVEHAEPVVGLVVEDPVGGRVRVGPRRHQLGPVRRPDRRRPARRAASARASGAHPSLCTASSRTPRPSPQPVHAANAPPPTWTSTRSRSAPASASSHPIVRPPSRHSAFSGPCTLNGTRAGGDGLAEPQHGRVARRIVGAPLARVDRRAERLEHGRARPATPTSARTRRSATTPAGRASPRRSPRCRTRRWRAAALAGRRRPQRLGGDEVQQDRDQVAGLVAAADVAGLVLDPHVGADGVGRQRRRAGERRDGEPVRELRASSATQAASVMPWRRANAHHARRGP